MPICKTCNIETEEFYASNKSECKKCVCDRVKSNRCSKIEYYRQYDRQRGNRQPKNYCKDYRLNFPKKYKAQTAVGNALRDGKMKKQPCEICGNDQVHAHHDDYEKIFDVRWLCAAHHRQWHIENGEAKNAT